MTIDIRSAVSSSNVNPTTALNVTIPGTTQVNDYIVLNATSRSHTASTDTATCLDNDTGGNDWELIKTDAARKAYAFGKRATAATAGKMVSMAGLKNSSCAGMTVYSGVLSTGTPYTDVAYEDNTATDRTHQPFTPDVAGCMIHVSVHNTFSVQTISAVTCTDPGTLTKRFEHQSSSGNGSGCAAYSSLQTAGPTSTGSFHWAQSADTATRTIAFALKPEPPSATSSAQNPQHTYLNAGTYTVTLTVTDENNLSSTSTAAVTVL